MANTRNANTFYIDTQYSVSADELAVKNVKVVSITVTATSSGGQVVLSDSNGNAKIDLRVATSDETQQFVFNENPIVFPTGIRPTTLTDAIVTCVIQESRS